LVLAVAVLAVLAIFSLTLGYNTRMELMATRNWANGIQARMAASTGVELFDGGAVNAPLTLAADERLSTLGPLTIRMSRDRVRQLAFDEAGEPILIGPHNPWADAETLIAYRDAGEALAREIEQDASAKININAIVPQREPAQATKAIGGATQSRRPVAGQWTEDALARFIERTLAARGVEDVNARQLAHNIAIHRYGPDRRPGRGGFDDNLNGAFGQAVGDGLDNDGDGVIDEADEEAVGVRNDRLDNNRDGRIDEDRESIEQDGLDNDGDGMIDEAGEAIDDPSESHTDPRLMPAGDDRPYASLNDLMVIEGMTPEIFEALIPHLTVFSSSFTAFDLTGIEDASNGGGLGFPQIDPNTASREMIFDVLRRRFPDAPDGLLVQFTVNLIDQRDADNVPTEWKFDNKSYLGYELTPYLSEVCSDTPSFDDRGDDGQFIEICNPYAKAIDVTNWVVRGAGPSIRLNGMLAAEGVLVLTNDFNDEHDPTPEYQSGLGSFYQVFNRVPTGPARRLEEFTTLDLPNDSGEVKLFDDKGRLIDVFSYSGGAWVGATRSFQRDDPRVRASAPATATPLQPNGREVDPAQAKSALQMQQQWHNRPFANALETMLVSSAWAEIDGGVRAESRPWAMPSIYSGQSGDLDVRLVDCFRVGAAIAEPARISKDSVVTDAAMVRSRSMALAAVRPACDVAFGRLNLNTASPAVLAVLPGMDDMLLDQIVGARGRHRTGSQFGYIHLTPERNEWWQEVEPLEAPVWRNLSDFLKDEMLWGDLPLYDRLDRVYPMLPLLTTHSASMWTLRGNRQPGPRDGDQRRTTTIVTERIVTIDRGAPETVTFGFYGRGSVAQGDPDLRYARPIEDQAELLSLKRMLDANGSKPAGLLATIEQ
jgi:DNA uptake protein ComE-like DNA-binding protein